MERDPMYDDFLQYIESILERELEPYEIDFIEKLVDGSLERAAHELFYGCGSSEPTGIVAISGTGAMPGILIPDEFVGNLINDIADSLKGSFTEVSYSIELLCKDIEKSFLSVEQHNQKQDLFRERRGYHDARKIKPQWRRPVTASARSKLKD